MGQTILPTLGGVQIQAYHRYVHVDTKHHRGHAGPPSPKEKKETGNGNVSATPGGGTGYKMTFYGTKNIYIYNAAYCSWSLFLVSSHQRLEHTRVIEQAKHKPAVAQLVFTLVDEFDHL